MDWLLREALTYKVDSDGWHEVVGENIIGESQQQGRFSDS
jgi:hypothetical protein